MLAKGRIGIVLGVLLLALVCGSCNSTPTLPLPPPIASAETPDGEGYALIQGQAQSLAYVSVLNERSEEGLITRADEAGDFKVRIKAEIHDAITIWQLLDGETGEQKHLTIPAPR